MGHLPHISSACGSANVGHLPIFGIQSPVKACHAFEVGDVRGLNAPVASRLASDRRYLSQRSTRFKRQPSSCNLGVALLSERGSPGIPIGHERVVGAWRLSYKRTC
jgi:hypothetical protein